MAEPRHILVVANETVAGKTLIDALRRHAEKGPIRVTVICPQNEPRAGFVVYADSRRSSADRRLRRTLDLLHEAGIAARGAVVDPDPLQAIKDAVYEYQPDEIIISTHPGELKSSWLRANLIERARKATNLPVEHVEVDLASPRERAHVLVIANQTILGRPLLDAIRDRAEASPADFTLLIPADAVGAERRLKSICALMADAGVEATGHLGDPDPVTAVENVLRDEQVDEIILSTFPAAKSGWMRRDVLGRVRSFGVPVTHVEVTPQEAEAAEEAVA
jgi:predicted TIM-barrel enzyme